MTIQSDAGSERAELDLLLRGHQIARMLRLVADLNIADKIDPDAGISIDGLASTCGALAEPLLRILRALASVRVFRVTPDGMVSHTPMSLLLRTDATMSMHYAARVWTAPGSWNAWGMLDSALRNHVPHQAAWKQGRFDYLRQHPEEGRAFDAFMAHFPEDRHAAIAAAYDFSGAGLIVDVGGGNGETLRQILSRFSAPRGLVYDRDDVVAAVPHEALLQGRITVEGGSFFDRVPQGGDIYLLIRVIHNWSDEDCLRILRICRAAMKPGSRLLVGEHILEADPTRGRPFDYLLDVQMMAMFGRARERSEADISGLFAGSGFELNHVIGTGSSVSIIEAMPC
jgi:hypothetical protein